MYNSIKFIIELERPTAIHKAPENLVLVIFGQFRISGALERTIWTYNMDVQYGRTIWTYNMDVQYGRTIWTYNMDVQYGRTIWTYNMDVQYGRTI